MEISNIGMTGETNGSLLYTECTKQQKDAGEYMKGLGKYSKITVTGHSLGGNLALYATIASSQEVRAKIGDCSTYNGPGFDGEFIKAHKEEIEQMGLKIHDFQNEYDATSSILYNLTKPIIIETAILVKNNNGTEFDNHSLSSLKSDINNKDKLKRSESGQKDYVCRVVNAASKMLEKLPKQYMRDAEEAKVIYRETVNLIKKCVENIVRDAILAGEAINEYIEMVDDAIHDFFSGIGTFISKHTGNHGKSNLYPKINVNKDNLKNISNRLQMVQSKIERLDKNLAILTMHMEVDEMIPVYLIEIKMRFGNDIKSCIKYLNNTIYELEQCERSIGQKAFAL